MKDPVIVDLNRYLSNMEDNERAAEEAELQLWNERKAVALRILNDDSKTNEQKAGLLVAWVEEEIEEGSNAYL